MGVFIKKGEQNGHILCRYKRFFFIKKLEQNGNILCRYKRVFMLRNNANLRN